MVELAGVLNTHTQSKPSSGLSAGPCVNRGRYDAYQQNRQYADDWRKPHHPI